MKTLKNLLLTSAGAALILGGLTLALSTPASADSEDYDLDGECVISEQTCTYSRGDDDIIRRGVRYCYYGVIDCPPCTPCGPRTSR
jgi:hypothetical protein